jgi:hypothetical protein
MLYLKIMVVCMLLLLLNEFRLVRNYAQALQNKQLMKNACVKHIYILYQGINQAISENNKLFN